MLDGLNFAEAFAAAYVTMEDYQKVIAENYQLKDKIQWLEDSVKVVEGLHEGALGAIDGEKRAREMLELDKLALKNALIQVTAERHKYWAKCRCDL